MAHSRNNHFRQYDEQGTRSAFGWKTKTPRKITKKNRMKGKKRVHAVHIPNAACAQSVAITVCVCACVCNHDVLCSLLCSSSLGICYHYFCFSARIRLGFFIRVNNINRTVCVLGWKNRGERKRDEPKHIIDDMDVFSWKCLIRCFQTHFSFALGFIVYVRFFSPFVHCLLTLFTSLTA